MRRILPNAEHHAVYQIADSGSLLDITPQVPSIPKTLFLRDDAAVYDFGTTDQRANITKALVNDRRISRLLELFAGGVALLNTVSSVGGLVTLKGEAAQAFRAGEREIRAIGTALAAEKFLMSGKF
jgi:hypothetical protein